MIIQTKRLKIYLATDVEMQELIDKTENIELKTAYTEMLNGAISNPSYREFYAMWFIVSLGGALVGEMCFKGIENGASEIGYGIEENFRHKGYGTESVKAFTDWALAQDKIDHVVAEVENGNVYSVKLLQKVGFVKAKTLENGNLIFIKRKK